MTMNSPRDPRKDPEDDFDDDSEMDMEDGAWDDSELDAENEDEDDEGQEEPGEETHYAPAPEVAREYLPVVAIVGRPNVGKSTLFNRLVGRRAAIVHEMPGMTRDRRFERVEWNGEAFLCVDTGGYDSKLDDPLLENVVEQARMAIDEADLVILVTAAGESNHPADQEMLDMMRRSRKPMIVAVNKCDTQKDAMQATDFYRFGFKDLHTISAIHGRGVAELIEAALAELKSIKPQGREYTTGGIAVAIVGRQNVGKSTLVNRLIGEERMIASNVAGTTRDSIDTTFTTPEGDTFTLIDTAGIRRRGKIERGVEKLTVLSSMLAIHRADVAILVVDATSGLTAQDAHIAGYCLDEGRACIVLVNKWDVVADKDHKTADEFTKRLRRDWGFLKFAPVLYGSALTGQRVVKLLEMVKTVHANAVRRIPTPDLNEHMKAAVIRRTPPIKNGRAPRFRYIAQVAVKPPTFAIFVNDPAIIHFSYERYMMNQMRESWDFDGTPIRLLFRVSPRKKRTKPGQQKESE